MIKVYKKFTELLDAPANAEGLVHNDGAGVLSYVSLTAPGPIGGTTPSTGKFTSIIAPIIKPTADSTTAIGVFKADGTTNVLNVDTTNSRVGIATAGAPSAALHLTGNFKITAGGIGLDNNQDINGTMFGGGAVTILKFDSGNNFNCGYTGSGAVSAFNGGTEAWLRANTFIGVKAVAATSYVLLGGNVGVGQTAFGTSAAKVFAISTGTAPTTSPADCFQLWSADVNGTAGAAGPHFRPEEANSATASQNAAIVVGAVMKADTGDLGYVHEGLVCINTYDNTVKIYADAGWRTIASGW